MWLIHYAHQTPVAYPKWLLRYNQSDLTCAYQQGQLAAMDRAGVYARECVCECASVRVLCVAL